MTEIFRMELTTPPKGKQRPRLGRGGRVFTPAQTRRYEKLLKAAARKIYQRPPAWGVLGIRVDAYFRRPAKPGRSHPCRKGPVTAFPMGMGGSTYPDASNVLKAAEDALNGVVYHDDKQISDARCVRYWADEAQASTLVITVWRIESADV